MHSRQSPLCSYLCITPGAPRLAPLLFPLGSLHTYHRSELCGALICLPFWPLSVSPAELLAGLVTCAPRFFLSLVMFLFHFHLCASQLLFEGSRSNILVSTKPFLIPAHGKQHFFPLLALCLFLLWTRWRFMALDSKCPEGRDWVSFNLECAPLYGTMPDT